MITDKLGQTGLVFFIYDDSSSAGWQVFTFSGCDWCHRHTDCIL